MRPHPAQYQTHCCGSAGPVRLVSRQSTRRRGQWGQVSGWSTVSSRSGYRASVAPPRGRCRPHPPRPPARVTATRVRRRADRAFRKCRTAERGRRGGGSCPPRTLRRAGRDRRTYAVRRRREPPNRPRRYARPWPTRRWSPTLHGIGRRPDASRDPARQPVQHDRAARTGRSVDHDLLRLPRRNHLAAAVTHHAGPPATSVPAARPSDRDVGPPCTPRRPRCGQGTSGTTHPAQPPAPRPSLHRLRLGLGLRAPGASAGGKSLRGVRLVERNHFGPLAQDANVPLAIHRVHLDRHHGQSPRRVK